MKFYKKRNQSPKVLKTLPFFIFLEIIISCEDYSIKSKKIIVKFRSYKYGENK